LSIQLFIDIERGVFLEKLGDFVYLLGQLGWDGGRENRDIREIYLIFPLGVVHII